MADKTITERLQPSLLDRLTDDHPGTRGESRDDRVIDVRRLRDIIRRDLSWLLNCANAETMIDPALYPQAAASVLNYGLPDVSGMISTADRTGAIRAGIVQAVTLFEPRIKPGTLDVVPRPAQKAGEALVVFDIRAEMWAQPLPMELYLRSEVDVTTGQITLERVG